MVDEIELLSRFRADIPRPSPDARARAWTAVMAAASEERSAIVAPFGSKKTGTGRLATRPVLALLGALAAVAVALTLALSSVNGTNRAPGTFTTGWEPSHLASRRVPPAGTRALPGGLRLVSYIEGPLWKEGSRQVPPGYLTCPATSACYLLAQTVLTTVGPYPNYYNSVYFSDNGGWTWSSLALPLGLQFTAPLSCPRAMTCVGVGYQGNKNEFVSTDDGGHRWLVSPLRAPANVMTFDCSTVSACSLVTESSYLGPGHPQQFASTSDGGANWYVHSFAADLSISSFSCPSADHCLAIASPLAKSGPTIALVTTDGGHNWTPSRVPGIAPTLSPSGEPGTITAISCASSSSCVVFGSSTYTESLESAAQLPRRCPPDGCLLRDAVNWQATVASTSDGGRRWRIHRVAPVYIGSYTWDYTPGQPDARARYSINTGATGFDLSCPQADDCWLSGPFGLLHSADDGSNWYRAAINHKSGLAQVSCPQPGQCIALGLPNSTVLNHQTIVYSDSVPVYSSISIGH